MNKRNLKYIVNLKESFDYGRSYVMVFEKVMQSVNSVRSKFIRCHPNEQSSTPTNEFTSGCLKIALKGSTITT